MNGNDFQINSEDDVQLSFKVGESGNEGIRTMSLTAAKMLWVINDMVEEKVPTAEEPPLPLLPSVVSPQAFKWIVEYCEKYKGQQETNQDWDREFVNRVVSHDEENERYYKVTCEELPVACEALGQDSLLQLVCWKIDDMLKGRTPEELQEQFGLPNVFTPEEEEDTWLHSERGALACVHRDRISALTGRTLLLPPLQMKISGISAQPR